MIQRDMFLSIYKSIIQSAPDFIFSLLIFIAFWLIAIVIKRIILGIANKAPIEKKPVILVLGSFSKASILIIGIITALGSLGVNVSALVASIGLSGFALSFAMKDALSNLLAGILILLYQPFKVSQHIKVSGFEGIVKQVSLRYTHLEFENKEILIPNSSLLTNSIIINGKKHEK